MKPIDLFSLRNRVAVITGGAGLLGRQHAEAIASVGGIPVLVDVPSAKPNELAAKLSDEWQKTVHGCELNITDPGWVEGAKSDLLARFGAVDILINNAANNPKVESQSKDRFSRFENFPLETWDADLSVGLTGAFLCSKAFGTEMARNGRGVILNIASDLSLIGPDQRLYRKSGVPFDEQPVKPVTYSVVKTGIIGLTLYLATYWADRGVRVNALSLGGVFTSQPDDFVKRLKALIPMGRMAAVSEYQGAIIFLCSDASSYMTGSNLVIDGGRTCW